MKDKHGAASLTVVQATTAEKSNGKNLCGCHTD